MTHSLSFPLFRKALIDARLSISDVCFRLGYTRQNLYQKLNGRARLNREEMIRICDLLGCSMDIWRVV